MSDLRQEPLYHHLNKQDTQSLLDIWEKGDNGEWMEEVFEVLPAILQERLGAVPPQPPQAQAGGLLRKAEKAYESGNLDEAFEMCSRALSINPDSTAGLCFRGAIYAELGQLNPAIRDYQRALLLDPNLTEALQGMRAIEADLEAQFDKPSARQHHDQGLKYTENKKSERALEEYQQALLLKPDLTDAWQEMRAIELDLEAQFDVSSARQHLDRALEYAENEEPGYALQEIELAKPVLPDLAVAYNYLGMIYETLGHVKPAIEAYLDAIRRNQRFSAARTNLRNARLRLEAEQFRSIAEEIPIFVEDDTPVGAEEFEQLENPDPDAPVLEWLYMDENTYHMTGWPGHRTRQGRSGYDPLESEFDAAHVQGVVIRRLLDRKLRTRNPFYLAFMIVFGLVLCLTIAPIIVTIRNFDWLSPVILVTQIPCCAVGIALLVNVSLSLWQRPSDESEDLGSVFY
jgi:tetratricopeptide (TPR) repeat protein